MPVPGGIGVAVRLYVVVVVGGGDAVAAGAVEDAGHLAVAAAGLYAAGCWAGPAQMAVQSQGWELKGQFKSNLLV